MREWLKIGGGQARRPRNRRTGVHVSVERLSSTFTVSFARLSPPRDQRSTPLYGLTAKEFDSKNRGINRGHYCYDERFLT